MSFNPPHIEPSFLRPSITDIRDIFPSATGVGIMLPEIGRGIAIGFNRLANFTGELNIASPTSKIRHTALFDLVRTFGFVVLKNCTAQTIPDDDASILSRGKDSDGKFIQDPFHYDLAPSNHFLNLPPEEYMSGIYKISPDAREEDSLWALEIDVKDAIRKLDADDWPIEVQDELMDMAKPDYHFRLFHPREHMARTIVKHQYPEFVDDVFRLIPDGRKYRQHWLKDKWDILIHANTYGDALHARPTGHMMTSHESPLNPLRGMYLYK